mmetsp:Transcript_62075/g.134716  ORF Transcript_62075/g.134716 Transcript_62075/m.134716 type:complete len:275 (-) Transcript_62075:105-929(-)
MAADVSCIGMPGRPRPCAWTSTTSAGRPEGRQPRRSRRGPSRQLDSKSPNRKLSSSSRRSKSNSRCSPSSLCVLPGQVRSPSPPRPPRKSSGGCRVRAPAFRALPDLPFFLEQGGAHSSSTPPRGPDDDCGTPSETTPGPGDDCGAPAQSRIVGRGNTAGNPGVCRRSRPAGRGRGDDGGLPQESCSAARGPTEHEVDRFIARCITHERSAALVQANAAMLDACIARLGEKGSTGEKRSEKIRRMLRLTDELRRDSACTATGPIPRRSLVAAGK